MGVTRNHAMQKTFSGFPSEDEIASAVQRAMVGAGT